MATIRILDPCPNRPQRRRIVLAIGVGVLLLTPSSLLAAPPEPDYWPTREWRTASPAAHGLDGGRLQELVDLIAEGERFPDLHSLLVVRHGYLVVEEYFAGQQPETLHMQQSVTKSFASAAIGIAIEQGCIESVREPVLGFFPEREGIDHVDERKRAMTLEDLLTMRSGTDYHERGPGSPHYQLNEMSSGWTEFILDRPMLHAPGTKFQYDSGAAILMSALIQARTGEHADVLLEKHLFQPLGIERSWWYRNREGHPHTGGGLRLRSRDMARFGLLYLHGGRWDDRQLVPAAWVEASTKRQVTFSPAYGTTTGYGYLWWILAPDPEGDGETEIFAACGAHAQYIFVVPEHDLVVVVTGATQNNDDENRPLGFLYSHILPAVERESDGGIGPTR